MSRKQQSDQDAEQVSAPDISEIVNNSEEQDSQMSDEEEFWFDLESMKIFRYLRWYAIFIIYESNTLQMLKYTIFQIKKVSKLIYSYFLSSIHLFNKWISKI